MLKSQNNNNFDELVPSANEEINPVNNKIKNSQIVIDESNENINGNNNVSLNISSET